MLRLLPPAGSPLTLRSSLRALSASRRQAVAEDLDSVRRQIGAQYLFGVSSGRAALALILRALKKLRPERDVVGVTGYNCFSVPAAVVRAGLKVQPLDLDADSLDFTAGELNRLPANRTLCIVAANLFGFMQDGRLLRQAAAGKGAFLVDDAAQAFGTQCNGEKAGMRGDVGFYSLGRGKCLPILGGAVVVTSDDRIAGLLAEGIRELPDGSSRVADFTYALAYSLFLHPWLYRVPASMPFLELGKTAFDPEFAIAKLPAFSAALYV